MANRDDRDILLPETRDPWRIVREVRALLTAWRPMPSSPPAQVHEVITADDLCGAFEYLAAECQRAGALLEDLTEALALRMANLTGQDRFVMQRRLAEAIGQRGAVGRFFVAMYLATRVPVPQARSALLQMLTQAEMGRWALASADGATNGHTQTFDLRPVVVAALGQLRDPSLLGLFHRLLEKLSGTSAANEPIISAVQWSLMNLAPGGQGEPVPMAMLSGKMSTESRGVQENVGRRLPAAEDMSRHGMPGAGGQSTPPTGRLSGNGQGAPVSPGATNSRISREVKSSVPSERKELLG